MLVIVKVIEQIVPHHQDVRFGNDHQDMHKLFHVINQLPGVNLIHEYLKLQNN